MDWRFNTIWFEQLEQNKIFIKDFKNGESDGNYNETKNAEYGIIWHLQKGKNAFENLNEVNQLLHLELYFTNIVDFSGIGKFKNLKRLELFNCYKLENDLELAEINNSLEFLHVNQCKKFKFTENLLKLNKLKVLCLNSCGEIENLDFLKYLPNLIDFRFVNTNIVDGNLNQIYEHPTIRTVGFINKRHYNFKFEDLKVELDNKNNSEYKTVIYKGKYSTYRYEYK